MRKLAGLRAICAELEAMRIQCKDLRPLWMRAGRELCKGYGRAFLLHNRQRWWIERTESGMSLLITTVPWNLMAAQMIFFIHQAPSQRRRWNSYSSSCMGHSRKTVRRLLQGWGVMECNREQGILVRREERLKRRKGEIHIPVQLAYWIFERAGKCMDSESPGSTGPVLRMAGVLDRLECLLLTSGVYAEERKASPTDWRGLLGAAEPKRLPAVEEHPTWVLFDHHGSRGI